MAKLTFDTFTGIFPRQGKTRLPLGAAAIASNVSFDTGRINSVRGRLDVDNVASNTNSIFKLRDKYWLTSSDELSYVDSPVVQDAHGRVYIAGGDYPVYAADDTGYSGWSAGSDIDAMARMPSTTYRLGLKAPTTAPTVTVNAIPAAEADVETLLGVEIELTESQSIANWLSANLVKVATAYVYTFVTDYGEESAPSPVSDIKEYYDGQTKTISLPSNAESGIAISNGKKRIYRVATGSQSSEYLFVAEVDYSVTSYTDTTLDSQLAEPITSTNYYPPPNDDTSVNPSGPLQSLVLHPQGFLIGHTGRTLCFSEPYLPHAWNPNNQMTAPSDVVGICVYAGGVVVGTKRKPYILSGSSAESMDIYPLESEQPCASARSMVEIGGAVVFASFEGLVLVNGQTAQIATEKHFNREQWADYHPESIHAYVVDQKYIGFYKSADGTASGGFVFDLATGRFTNLSYYAEAGFFNPDDDVLYLVEGTDLKKYERGSAQPYLWKSGDIRLHNNILFQRMKIEADHSVTVTLQIDNEDFFGIVVKDSDDVLLPSGMRGEYFNVQLSGTGTVDTLSISDDALELEP